MKTTVSMGTDPEFFIFEVLKDKYKIITADKILPGKEDKLYVSCGGDIFFDGVQAEINPRAGRCREILAGSIRILLKEAYKLTVDKYSENVVFAPLATIKLTKEDLIDVDSECLRFGCSPDMNIYDSDGVDYPNGRKFLYRFSGGHIHIGFNTGGYQEIMKQEMKVQKLIKMLDAVVGTMSVALIPTRMERFRSNYYGKAGTFRIQPHGLEYRSLSSYWMVSPQMQSLIFGLVRDCFTYSANGMDDKYLSKFDMDEVVRVINNSDIKGARDIYNDIIKPSYVYSKDKIDNSPMRHKVVRDLVDMMMEKGCNYIFNPYNMLKYWEIVGDGLYGEWNNKLGIWKFAYDIQNGFFTPDGVREL